MSEHSKAASQPRRLDVFVPPTPSPLLIKALVPVNRVLCLGGVPGLRALPLVGRLPGLRGLADIRSIDLPEEHEARLRTTAAPENATFLAPNHPEFFTDWMIDKEVLARVAPLAACWATNSIVNGMGALAQKFWLKNNLIAQIPGVGGGQAKAHSIAWASQGHGVLLHPEGTVGWHGDRIGRLFPGAIEMAAAAWLLLRSRNEPGRALVQPMVWKLVFTADATGGMKRELAHVETQLDLRSADAPVAERILAAYRALLFRSAERWGLAKPADASFDRQQRQVLEGLADRLRAQMRIEMPANLAAADDPEPRLRPLLRAADRALRDLEGATGERRTDAKQLLETMRKLLRFRPSLYPEAELTQEHLAENIKRLRGDYCSATFADRVDRMIPRPAAPRIAHIRVPEPIDVGAVLGAADELSEAQAEALVDALKARMQAALDGINAATGLAPRTDAVVNAFQK